MPNPYFSFKRFTVYHDECAMKVGTDACLLGAWAAHPSPKRILDVGAGSGIISLMLAQRYKNALIDAVEIETKCAEQCKSNCAKSPFSARLRTHNIPIQAYQAEHSYDLIISNPPYFSSSFKPPNSQRQKARHDDSLDSESFFKSVSNLLSPDGILCIIIPVDRFDQFMQSAGNENLFLNKQVFVKPNPTKSPKRVLLGLSHQPQELTKEEFYIERERGAYSDHFKYLLRDFYLHL